MQLPKYGPMTELSSCKADLKAAEERIRQLERSLSSAEAENQLSPTAPTASFPSGKKGFGPDVIFYWTGH